MRSKGMRRKQPLPSYSIATCTYKAEKPGIWPNFYLNLARRWSELAEHFQHILDAAKSN